MAGQICAVLANVHRAKDAKVFEAGDFMPLLAPHEADTLPESSEAIAAPTLDLEAMSKPFERMLGRKEES